ncbi:DELLA protein GAI1 [Acorus calamus]|uniref:DELLA protein GAI1 n=1 Tax=Acorus calamus TaxID=4465 RepID=A0AAV9EZJ3_ACOCL|nr:DELLA protein GAI1 [Acorus calamus]
MPGPSPEWDEALELAYKLCPFIRFGHYVANESMLEVLAGESSAHVVDLGMSLGLPMGHQWRDLIQRLVDRPGPPMRRIRLTGVGPRAERLESIGDGLVDFARGLGLELEFRAITTSLEDLRPEDVGAEKGEALVVNSVLELHHVVKESRGALNSVLRTVHGLAPRVLVLVEQDVNHNGPFFMGRFMEALHYYSAVFDALDMALPRYDTRRAKMEQFYFAEEIRNIVSCEGPARVERHERADQWRRRMSRAGFQPSPVKMGAQAKGWLGREGEGAHGFTVVEDKGCLTLGWKSKPIVTASCWKC